MTKVALKPILTALACSTLVAGGVQIRSYSAADHDRFTGFPTSPVINDSSFFDGSTVRGIGWRSDQNQWQFALITRSHVLFVTHAAPPIGSEIRFLNDGGMIVSRLVASKAVVRNDDGSDSDLTLVGLSAPIDVADGVAPLPYLDLSRRRSYLGRELVVFGKFARAGKGVIGGFTNLAEEDLNPTSAIRFDYDENGDPVKDAGDAKLETGDSGSPSLHRLADGRMCLVGIHMAIDSNEDETIQFNYDGFVPDYAEEIDALLAPAGYRMTPVTPPTTALGGDVKIITGNPRRANPLTTTLVLENTGSDPTGNLEVDFRFAAGEGPDSITGTGWIAYGSGSDWTLRRSLLEDSTSTTLTLSWSAAPLVENLSFQIDWRSDKTTGGSLSTSQILGPSFNEWAVGLAFPGQGDDPDGDWKTNLSEYAFGSDPENGSNLLPNGEPACPSLSLNGDLAILTYPERSDAAGRGLSYHPEWTQELDSDVWSATPPAGLLSSTSSYDPQVPGFVKRSLSWPIDGSGEFVRVRIQLEE